MNKLSEYIYFTYQKTLIHRLFCLFLKLLKAFSVSLIQVKLNRSSHQRCSVKKLFLKNCNIFRKTPVLEHLSNKVTGVQACSISKRDSNPRFFLWILRNFFEHLSPTSANSCLFFPTVYENPYKSPYQNWKDFE